MIIVPGKKTFDEANCPFFCLEQLCPGHISFHFYFGLLRTKNQNTCASKQRNLLHVYIPFKQLF